MGYESEVHTRVQEACSEVESLLAQRLYPFNHAEQAALYRETAAATNLHRPELKKGNK